MVLFKNFKNYLPNQHGDIININTKKKVLEHIGLMYYTIGQRRGLDVGGRIIKEVRKNNQKLWYL